jgi:hypothetical protein
MMVTTSSAKPNSTPSTMIAIINPSFVAVDPVGANIVSSVNVTFKMTDLLEVTDLRVAI